MGWKASAVIINQPTPINHEELLKELGFSPLTKIEDSSVSEVINPDDNEVYIGSYKNNLLICAPDLPIELLEEEGSRSERKLINLFPNAEIAVIILHSVVNLWGYCVIKNGKRIRARAGSSEDGTFLEVGEPLEEEKELLSKSRINENGQRIYIMEDDPEEIYSEDQVGENFVFSLCKRYFGEELDSDEELLFETTLSGYSYGKPAKTAPQPKSEMVEITKHPNNKKPWWRFW